MDEESYDAQVMIIRDDLNRLLDLFEESKGEVGITDDDADYINSMLIFTICDRLHTMSHTIENEDVAKGIHFASFVFVDLLQAVQMRSDEEFDISYFLDEEDYNDE